ncbi:hypothetical protein [Clostridium sp. DL1XJH146]
MKSDNNKKNKKKDHWILKIFLWTIVISTTVSFFSNLILQYLNTIVAIFLLLIIITIGIIFDTIGVAVTAASETPFHSMASKRIKEANVAVNLIRNADKVSNFCNDVIGDICGVISGGIGALIFSKVTITLILENNYYDIIISSLIGAVIAALTVGGKALGKSVAINRSNDIVFQVSKLIYLTKKDR